MFEINQSSEQSIACLMPKGRLDTVNSAVFEAAVQALVENELFLIIDFSHCPYLSSTGIRVLLMAVKKLVPKGGALFLTHVSPDVFQVFEMAGLQSIFRFAGDETAAACEICKLKATQVQKLERQIGNYHFQWTKSDPVQVPFRVWNDAGIAGYPELGYSVGIGSMAESPEEIDAGTDLFIGSGHCAGFLSADGSADFRTPIQPGQAGILVGKAVSFGPCPEHILQLSEPQSIPLTVLSESLHTLSEESSGNKPKKLAMISVDFNPIAPMVYFCLLVNPALSAELESWDLHELPDRLWGARFALSQLPENLKEATLNDFLTEALTLENILDVLPLDLSATLTCPTSWLFTAENLMDASLGRIQLEIPEEGFSEPCKSFLVRRLFTDSLRVCIKPLHGGFSAQTFQVISYDKEGRKLRPTVLKIANRAIIMREATRCQQYASPYILNNSAMVLGTEFFGDVGALRYNFVGIGGEQTQLRWMTHHYENMPLETLKLLFDKTFKQILNPWYGQTVEEEIYPFKDHDPTFTFFPHIYDMAAEVLSVSSDEPELILEENGQRLVNPYWFLKYEYPRLREKSLNYRTSICHGDLNMQNILLDQDSNVYLIDFSETRPRSVISDFARLEAIFMVERAPLDDEKAFLEMVEFVGRFYGIDRLDVLPLNSYLGSRPDVVERNVVMALKMREYALLNNGGKSDLLPYYIAMLEWVLPIVCYYVNPVQKRFSMIVAGLLCQKVMKELSEYY